MSINKIFATEDYRTINLLNFPEINLDDKFNRKDILYMDYVNKHRYYNLLCFNFLIDINNQYNFFSVEEIKKVKQLVLEHDLSKYSYDEFMGYKRYFHDLNEDDRNDLTDELKKYFDTIWDKHCLVNSHHSNSPLYKNKEDFGALLCDFGSMSIFYKNNPYDFYKEEEKELILRIFNDKRDISMVNTYFIELNNILTKNKLNTN